MIKKAPLLSILHPAVGVLRMSHRSLIYVRLPLVQSALTPIFYGLKPLVKSWGWDSFLISSYLGRSAGVRREITIANITSCPDPILATVLNLDCLCQNKTNKSSLPRNGPNYFHLTNTFSKIYWVKANVVSWFTIILVKDEEGGANVVIRVNSLGNSLCFYQEGIQFIKEC